MCSKNCEACDYVSREECDRIHDRLQLREDRQDEKIAIHGETLAAVNAILDRMPQTHPTDKKSFWEGTSGKMVIFGIVALVLMVVSYALGAENTARILAALPK